jgi:hypothetical protein
LASSAVYRIRCRSRRAGRDGSEPFPKAAIYCHLLPFCSRKTASFVSTVSVHFLRLEGVPASLSPGLRTVSGAMRSLGAKLSPGAACPMTGESTNSQKMLLAAAIAEGMSVAKWASSNEVSERTAYRWAAEPEVRSETESIRRRALDEAIGRLAKRATWAVDGIVELGENAASESVRLSALRAVMSDFIAVSNFAGLEGRVAELEEQFHACTDNAS